MTAMDRMSAAEQRQPNYALMKQRKQAINRAVLQLDLGFAEDLHDQLGRLDTALNAAHSSIMNSTVAMMPMLRNADFLNLRATLDELGTDQELEPVLRDRAAQELREGYIDSVNAGMRSVRASWLEMSAAINAVDDIVIVPAEELLEPGSVDLEAGLRLSLQDLDNRLGETEAQRLVIDDLIKVYDDKNLFDHLLPWIASDEELDGLNLSAPQVEMVKRGVRLFRKLIEQASQYIRYAEMVKLRDGLRSKHQHYQEQKDKLNELLADSIRKSQTLRRVGELEGVRLDYVTEARLLARQIGGFVTAFDLARSTSLESLGLISAQGVALYKTLEPIASAWRTK